MSIKEVLEKVLLQKYYDKGHKLKWGKNLTKGQIKSLKSGEIFTLIEKNKLISKVLMDSCGQIRKKRLV